MDIEQTVENLAGEVWGLREDMVQMQAYLLETLETLGTLAAAKTSEAPASSTRPAAGASVVRDSEHTASGPAHGAAQPPAAVRVAEASKEPRPLPGRVAVGSHRAHGGLIMSQEELDLVMDEVRTSASQPSGADDRNGGTPGLSLERLVQAVKRGRRDGAQARTATGKTDSHVTMSVAELADMLRQAQGIERQEEASARPAVAAGSTSAESPGPSASGDTHARSRPPVEAHVGSDREHKLDVNMMASLMRWADSARRRLGVRGVHSLLETYMLTGHLPASLQSFVLQIVRMEEVFDVEGEVRRSTSYEDMTDCLLQLHGIVYGAGRATIGPAMDIDLSGLRLLDTGQPGELTTSEAIEGRNRESTLMAQPAVREAAPPSRTQDSESHTAVRPSQVQNEGTKSRTTTDNGSRGTPSIQEALDSLGLTAAGAPPLEKVEESVGAHLARVIRDIDARRAGSGQGVRKALVNQATRNIGNGAARKSYRSDLTDAEWGKVEPLVPPPKAGGRPCKYNRREILNGILYQLRTGCSWRSLPHDLPPWKIVHHYYRVWRDDGSLDYIWEAVAELGHRAGSAATSRVRGTATPPLVAAGTAGPSRSLP